MKWLLSLLLLLPMAVQAADTSQDHYNRISLSASATGRTDNDTMIATLYAQEEGPEAALLADRVNQRIRWGVDQVRQYDKIKVQTLAYNTYPIYRKDQISGWRVRQSFRIESQNMALVSKLLGTLQSKLALENIHFSVSPAQRNAAQNELIRQALAAFETRAKLVASALHHAEYKIVRLNINTAGGGGFQPQPRVMMSMRADVADGAPPVVQAGESVLTVSVSGEIELQ